MRVVSHRYSVGIVLTVEDNDDGLTGIATEACEAGVIVITWVVDCGGLRFVLFVVILLTGFAI